MTEAYDAFGNQESAPEEDFNPFRYAGEYYGWESGLIYLRARYYDSHTGRFLNEDPIRDGMNGYVFAANNPVKYIDPTGLANRGAYFGNDPRNPYTKGMGSGSDNNSGKTGTANSSDSQTLTGAVTVGASASQQQFRPATAPATEVMPLIESPQGQDLIYKAVEGIVYIIVGGFIIFGDSPQVQGQSQPYDGDVILVGTPDGIEMYDNKVQSQIVRLYLIRQILTRLEAKEMKIRVIQD